MLISAGESYARVVRATPDEHAWLRRCLRFKDAAESKRLRRVVWVEMLDWLDKTFPVGLVPIVREQAAKKLLTCDLVDARRAPVSAAVDPKALAAEPYSLRDYQVEAVQAAASGGAVQFPIPGRGIIRAPTGAGKSRIAAAIMDHVPGRWVFLVHRAHLAADVAQRWESMSGERAGWIGDGKWRVGDRVTVATLQSLHAAREDPRFAELCASTDGVVVDECHVAAAQTFGYVISAFDCWWKVGLSGTPLDRSDQRSVLAVAHLGPVIYSIPAETLIARGYLARPTIRAVPMRQPPMPKRQGPDGKMHSLPWAVHYKSRISRSAIRNEAVMACIRRAARPGMVFVREVKHGLELAKAAAAEGINCDFVDGDKKAGPRDTALKRLARGDTDFIIATKVFNEGVDIPCLESVVLAGGGKSVIDTLQQIGRAMRVTSSKDTCTVYDIADKGDRVTHEHAKKRLGACQREGYPIIIDREIFPKGDP